MQINELKSYLHEDTTFHTYTNSISTESKSMPCAANSSFTYERKPSSKRLERLVLARGVVTEPTLIKHTYDEVISSVGELGRCQDVCMNCSFKVS